MSEQTNVTMLASTDQATDAVLRPTRVVAAVIIPFLIAAFVILYLLRDATATLFAWQIRPPLTAAFMGAGYLGGAYFFLRVLFEKHWHRVAAGFPAITVFTWWMLLATLLHWDRFDVRHWPFLVWLVLYVVTPIAVPAVWLLNRRTDPHTLEAGDYEVPLGLRVLMAALGSILLIVAVVLTVSPQLGIDRWPWSTTPLSMRVLSGWQALLGAGAIALALDRRWSAWRIPLETILLWQGLVLVALVLHRGDLTGGTLMNPFTAYTLIGFLGAGLLYVFGELNRKRGRR